jgi:hypothetical protein
MAETAPPVKLIGREKYARLNFGRWLLMKPFGECENIQRKRTGIICKLC